MRKLYREFFYVPKHEKVKDKVMLVRMATTITIVVMCLLAMSLTAYAYFSCDVTSASNTIKAATFEAQITINDGVDDVPLTTDEEYRVATLQKDKPYTVMLTAPTGSGSAETGFCIITIGEKTYHTAQIGKDIAKNSTDASVTFNLKVAEETTIKFFSHWGTSSFYGYENLDNNSLYIKSEGCVIDLGVVTQNAETDGNDDTLDVDDTTIVTPSTNTETPSAQTMTSSENTSSENGEKSESVNDLESEVSLITESANSQEDT